MPFLLYCEKVASFSICYGLLKMTRVKKEFAMCYPAVIVGDGPAPPAVRCNCL